MVDGSAAKERERGRCEEEAALLLTPPSFRPCRTRSVKAEEERSRRRSRQTAARWESQQTGKDEGIY